MECRQPSRFCVGPPFSAYPLEAVGRLRWDQASEMMRSERQARLFKTEHFAKVIRIARLVMIRGYIASTA
jgi:hypothetical protein